MILEDDDVDERLASPDNLINVIVKPLIHNHRGLGDTQVPDHVRELAGRLANMDGNTQVEVAEAFDISHTTVSKASRGMVGDRFIKSLRNATSGTTESKTETAHEQALDLLMTGLIAMKPKLALDETAGMKPKELSRIISDMSKVVSSLKGNDDKAGNVNNTQVVIFAPPTKKESDYESISA